MITPARFLLGTFDDAVPYGFISDPNSIWAGYPYIWDIRAYITPQPTSDPGPNYMFSYNASDIVVGDWFAFSNGIASKIIEIVSLNDNEIVIRIEDHDLYNTYSDPSTSGNNIGPAGDFFIFSLDENGFPILGPLPANIFDSTIQDNILARFAYTGSFQFGGGSEFIGTPDSGDYTNGTFDDWVPDTKISNAFQDTTNLLNKIIEPGPIKVRDWDLYLSNLNSYPFINNSQSRYAQGTIPNFTTDNLPDYEQVVIVSPDENISFSTNGYGISNKGELTFSINDQEMGKVVFDENSNIGTYGSINITSDYAFGTIPDFRYAFDAYYNAVIEDGYNKLQLSQTYTGSKDYFVIKENLIDPPVESSITFDYNISNVTYISGVPHLTDGSSIIANFEITNMVGRTFKTILFDSTVEDINQDVYELQTFTYNNPSINVSVFDQNLASFTSELSILSILPQTGFNNKIKINSYGPVVSSNFYTTDNIVAISENTGYLITSNPTSSSIIRNLKRITLDNFDRPVVDDGTIDWATNFDDGSSNQLGDLKLWEAPIIGGKVVWSQENMSIGYHPVGPDFSSKPDTQYASFKLQSIKQRLFLKITGTYQNLYVKLPGIENNLSNTQNGWFNALKPFDFPATLWPGHPLASDGCLVNNTTNYLELTFGSLSSAFSTDNLILLQFELAEGDFISELHIVGE